MKSFLQFFKESTAVQQATRMGLQSDGHGGWYDKNGEFVAKTEKGSLKFFNKRQQIGKQDPPQSDKEKNLSQTTSEPAPQKEPVGAEKPEMIPPEVEKTKGTLTVAFGRFNPPTTGHEKLLDTVASSSDEGDYIIIPSRSQDRKKNPLDPDTKVSVMRQMYPKHSEKIINDPANRTIFDVLKKAHNDGYTNVRIVGGGDRVKEFENISTNYNGKLYQFDNIEVTSAGDRDPDSEGTEGMSASKQRKAAAENDFSEFRKGVPSVMDDKAAKMLFTTLRKSMKLQEGWSLWEIAPKFDWKNLRENFVTEKIYRIGQIVENDNTGLIGEIIRRGTNYLICVTEDGIMFKSWIKDVIESRKHLEGPIKNIKKLVEKTIIDKKPQKNNNITTISGVSADQRLVGTDEYRKYVETMVPGSSYGLHFINKYRKK